MPRNAAATSPPSNTPPWWRSAGHPGIDATRVSELIYFDHLTIGDVLDRIEAKGWIVRRPAVHDRRVKVLELTQLGRTTLHAVAPGIGRVQSRLLAPLSRHEAETFVRLLAKVADGSDPAGRGRTALTRGALTSGAVSWSRVIQRGTAGISAPSSRSRSSATSALAFTIARVSGLRKPSATAWRRKAEQMVVVAGRIEDGARLGVDAEDAPGDDLEQFLKGADAAGQGDEGVGLRSAINALRTRAWSRRRAGRGNFGVAHLFLASGRRG